MTPWGRGVNFRQTNRQTRRQTDTESVCQRLSVCVLAAEVVREQKTDREGG
eukprot:COSAG03_NODE_499_length_7409_cov_11.656088_13_plen_51_part_00